LAALLTSLSASLLLLFFFNDPATTEIYTLSLHDALPIYIVAHDIGNMVAFAFAARYPKRISRLVLMDAPIPGVGPWEELAHAPRAWHFYFYGPDEERLVAGRERIYLDRFYDELSANPAQIDNATRDHYAALHAPPRAKPR